jgi:restriction system protein
VADIPLLTPLLANWPGFAVLFGFYLLFKFLASPRVKGRIGEASVKRAVLQKLDPQLYRHYHDLYLARPDGRGTTQIDHVVVSPYGIFVIETKNYKGWIFGSEKQRQWTQQIYRNKSRFQNPLHQNHLHVRALMALLNLPENRFRPVVVFAGEATFKTEMPPNVINRGLISWIKNHTATVLDPPMLETVHQSLSSLVLSTDKKEASRAHLAGIQTRRS